MTIYSVTNPHRTLLIFTIIWIYQYFSDSYQFVLYNDIKMPKSKVCDCDWDYKRYKKESYEKKSTLQSNAVTPNLR